MRQRATIRARGGETWYSARGPAVGRDQGLTLLAWGERKDPRLTST